MKGSFEDFPIDDTLGVLRTHKDAGRAWSQVIKLCRGVYRKRIWNNLPVPAFESDIHRAGTWLRSELKRMPTIKGIYLGLDTLNMEGREGFNVEFAGTSGCDPARNSGKWVWGDMDYGGHHLIRSLYTLQKACSSPEWDEIRPMSEYILFLACSGIVFAGAFQLLNTEDVLLPVWGFHDGDLFILGRKKGDFKLICREVPM